jgi:hypothetical protein
MGPLPSGGISEEQAVSLAQKAAPLSALFESAKAGPYASVYTDPEAGAGSPIDPNQEVWVVTFAATATPCRPNGSGCESPRPGTATVVLDFWTGKVFGTFGNYPKP